jgi:flavin reductase (DIM6/NTAB) family NADH-FMN oxidoreductase RutF
MKREKDTATDFSRLSRTLDYPVYVVTTCVDGERTGCLIGFGTQCSVHPPRFLACLSRKNHTFDIAMRAATLAVHVMEEKNRSLAELFGGETGDAIDKFAQAQWQEVNGMPVLTDCARWFVGTVLQRFDLGDHVGHLLEPISVAPGPAREQLTYQEARDIPPGHDP